MEERIRKLENDLFNLQQLIAHSQSYSEGIQSSLWDSEAKQKEKNRDLSNSTNNVANNLFNFQYTTEANISSAYHSGLHLAGDYTIHNNILWKCLSTTTNAPRDGAEWVQTNITEMMMDLANRISKLEANKEV